MILQELYRIQMQKVLSVFSKKLSHILELVDLRRETKHRSQHKDSVYHKITIEEIDAKIKELSS